MTKTKKSKVFLNGGRELYWRDLIDTENQNPEKLTLDDIIAIADRDEFMTSLIPSKKHRRALMTFVGQILNINDPVLHETIYMMLIAWYPLHEFKNELEMYEALVKYYAGTIDWSSSKQANIILAQLAGALEAITDILEKEE